MGAAMLGVALCMTLFATSAADFVQRCPHEEGWTYILDYSDDRSIQDIPNNITSIAGGFETTNAYFRGMSALESIDDDVRLEMCIVSSASNCLTRCMMINNSWDFPCACAKAQHLGTPAKRFLGSMAGVCRADEYECGRRANVGECGSESLLQGQHFPVGFHCSEFTPGTP